jgi:hypothetical protein
MGASAGR